MSTGGGDELVIPIRLDRAPAQAAVQEMGKSFMDMTRLAQTQMQAAATQTQAFWQRLNTSVKQATQIQTDAAKQAAAAMGQSFMDMSKLAATHTQAVSVQNQAFWGRLNTSVQQAVAVQSRAAEQAKAANRSWLESFQHLGGGIDDVSSRLAGMAASAFGIRAVLAVFRDFNEAIREGVQGLEQEALNVLKLQGMLQQIGVMRGLVGQPQGPVMAEHRAMRAQAGFTREMAISFATEYSGAVEAFKGNLPGAGTPQAKAMEQQVQIQAARVAAARGAITPQAAAPYGQLAGFMPAFHQYKTVGEMKADMMKTMAVLAPGIGEDPQLLTQGMNIAGALVREKGAGGVESLPQLMAIIATASLSGPGRAEDMTRQALRFAQYAGRTKGRGAMMQPIYKKMGIQASERLPSVLKKMTDFLSKLPEDVDPTAWMVQQGAPQDIAMMAGQFTTYRNQLASNLATAARPFTEAQAEEQIQGAERTDVQRHRRAVQATELTRERRGEMFTGVEILREEARNRLEQRFGPALGAEFRARGLMVPLATLGGRGREEGGERIAQAQTMIELLRERRPNIRIPGLPKRLGTTYDPSEAFINFALGPESDEAFRQAIGNASFGQDQPRQEPEMKETLKGVQKAVERNNHRTLTIPTPGGGRSQVPR